MDKNLTLSQKAHDALVAAQMQHAQLTENVVYLMGLSFVLGSFFTILILILLDFMRRDQVNNS